MSGADEQLLERLKNSDSSAIPAATANVRGLFYDLLGDNEGVVLKKLDEFLGEARNSSADLEERALQRVRQRYLEAVARYDNVVGACETPAADYDGRWAAELRKKFGDTLEAHTATLRFAIAAARAHVMQRCTAAARAELLDAELSYHTTIEDQLRDWIELVNSSADVPSEQKTTIGARAESLARLLRKTSLARMIADGHEVALLEAKAEKLPPDVASALAAQSWLSKPFDLMRAVSDLNQSLELSE